MLNGVYLFYDEDGMCWYLLLLFKWGGNCEGCYPDRPPKIIFER